jgi:hypothetical protein
MSSKTAQEILLELTQPGLLIRSNAGQVFYITQKQLNAFLLPDDFQIGGVASSAYFARTVDNQKQALPTGDKLAEALDAHQKIGGLSGLRNAAYLPEGLMGINGLAAGKFPIDEVKGGKPMDDLPAFIPFDDP